MSISAFNSALQARQYSRARDVPRKYQGERLVSLFSNRVVFAAQIATDLSAVSSWAELTFYDVTVGDWTDVIEGQAVIISDTDDITTGDFFRTRLVPTSSLFYPNESSQNFSAGAYIWVIDNYLPQYKLSRPSTSDPLTAVEKVDYNTNYQGMLPIVKGLQTGYGGYVNPSTGKLRLGFDVSQSLAANSGSAISSTNFSFTGETVVAGALNESIVIVDLDYGEQWGHCTVDDDGGRGLTRHFGIQVHDPALYPTNTGFKGNAISATLDQGFTLTLPAFAGVDDILDNTFCIVWRNAEAYGGDDGDLYESGVWADITNKQLTSSLATLTSVGHPFVPGQTIIIADVGTPFNGTFVITSTTTDTFSYAVSAGNVASTPCSGMGIVNPRNVDFVGWLNREDDPVQSDMKYAVISRTTFSFTGVGPRLARLTAQLLAFIQSASPTRWGDITNLTPWRAIWHFLSRYTTLGNLCDVWFDSTDNTYLFPAIDSQGGNALATIQGIAKLIDANVEFAPWGAIAVKRDVNFTHTGTVVSQWTSADIQEFSRSYDPLPSVGKVDGDGAFYNATSAQVTDYTGRAPGIAQGEAEGSGSYPARVLASTTSTVAAVSELLQRIGDEFEFENLREFMDITFRAGYVGVQMMPSRSQVSTLTINDTLAGDNGINRVVYTTITQWTIENTNSEFNAERGSFTVKARLRRVTVAGDPGDDTTVVLPAPGEIPEALPDPGLPAFNWELPEVYFPDIGSLLGDIAPSLLLPPKGRVVAANGSELIVWSATQAFMLRSFIALRSPTANEVTPSDLGGFDIKQIVVEPSLDNFRTRVGAYLLACDSTSSKVAYCSNIAAPGASALWTWGATIPGAYSVIRVTSTPGSIEIYTTDGSLTETLYDFTLSDQGFVVFEGGVYSAGVGWVQTNEFLAAKYYVLASIQKTVSSQRVVAVEGTYDVTATTYADAQQDRISLNSDAPAGRVATRVSASGTDIILAASCDVSGVTTIYFVAVASENAASYQGGTVTLKSLKITTATTGGDSATTLSTDYGETWNAPNTVGATPGLIGGYDIQRVGTVGYAAAAGKVRKSTTLGGSYSDWYSVPGSATPVCIIIPYRRRNSSTKNTNVSDPDVVIGCSDGKWYWIDGTAATATDITPAANLIPINENSITTLTGDRIAVIGSVSGTKRLYVSTNGGTSWTLAETMTNPTFVRVRRNDSRVSPNGQLFVMDSNAYYSSKFASLGVFIRTLPTVCTGLETVW